MTRERLRIGISPCPNDTFAFHGLLTGAIDIPGVELALELADVEELNRGLARGAFDAAKASFATAQALSGDVALLASGAALGFGVGPVVVAPPIGRRRLRQGPPRVLAPGAGTTAALLWSLFHAGEADLEHVRFSDILPALERGDADLGLCIHEGRFTYRERGLVLVEDLGERWERETGAPLPLGGIFARRSLGPGLAAALAEGIRRSIDHARAEPERALATMRRHAQEHSDLVLWRHVELYVNAETREISPRGRGAVRELARRSRAAGLLPGSVADLDVLPA